MQHLHVETSRDPDLNVPVPMQDPRYWISSSLSDLFFLCSNVLSHGKKEEYQDLNWIHMELCDFLDMEKNPIPQKLVLMSRDILKTSIGRGFAIQWFLRKRRRNHPGKIGLYCGVYELGEDFLDRVVKEILTNELLQTFFHRELPQRKKDIDVCQKDKLRYKGIEIDVGSPEKSLTGHHYEGIINDNLCNELNTENIDQCKKIIKRWQQQESVLAERAWEIIFETTWEAHDLSGIILDPDGRFDYKQIYRKPCKKFIAPTGYAVFSCPARGEDGKPVFPEKMDEAYLERKRIKQGPYIYSRMYELQVIPDTEVIFRRPWIKNYDDLPYNFIRNIVVDCAGTTKKDSSFSAISIWDWDEHGTAHIPFAEKRKLTPMQLIDWLIEVYDQCEKDGRLVTFVGVEKEKYGIFLASYFEQAGNKFHVWPIDIRGRTRNARIMELMAPYEQGRILHAKTGMRDYENELLSWYKGKEVDCDILDTSAYQLDMKIIPRPIPKLDFVPNVPDDARAQFRKDLESIRGGPLKERVRAMF